ncbi:membrane protein DedA, SNARE-associated domain [Klenkia soli]|uniref:Membrane protein DedA, SNARE-associated domain n=1 Tax=Klenkia soli TaxID=1052260 RepID=A0A1H0IPF0_9ACTN|nr:DedA family protein [Klenkia soli]SDO33317.1 membrane protein DedA, SNARE-associated domain [Klenkia soli]
MSVASTVADAATGLVNAAGNAGLAAVMAVEAVLPVPSEVVLPLVGSQVAAGQMSYVAAVLAATLGSTLGAWAVFAAGRAGGRARVQKLARIIGLDAGRWDRMESWFDRRGSWVVLLGRLVPGVRVLINLPVGSLGMPTAKFLALTAAGSAVWNAAWIGAGSTLGAHWETLLAALVQARPAVLLAAAVGLFVVLARQTRVRAVLG